MTARSISSMASSNCSGEASLFLKWRQTFNGIEIEKNHAKNLRCYEVGTASGSTTMSVRLLSTIAFSSACSGVQTLNSSSVC